jgi:hypothetical protein
MKREKKRLEVKNENFELKLKTEHENVFVFCFFNTLHPSSLLMPHIANALFPPIRNS